MARRRARPDARRHERAGGPQRRGHGPCGQGLGQPDGGGEAVLAQIEEIEASDFSAENLEELGNGGAEASEEVRRQAETCGDPMDDIEVPELEMPETTE